MCICVDYWQQSQAVFYKTIWCTFLMQHPKRTWHKCVPYVHLQCPYFTKIMRKILGPNSLLTKMFYHVLLLCHNKWSSLFPFSHGFCGDSLPLPLFFSLLDEIGFKVLSYICFIFYQKKMFLKLWKMFFIPSTMLFFFEILKYL